MGRPPTGAKLVAFRLLPQLMARIKRVIQLKKKEKTVTEYVVTSVESQLKRDEKKLGVD
jgi:hypothetical protein